MSTLNTNIFTDRLQKEAAKVSYLRVHFDPNKKLNPEQIVEFASGEVPGHFYQTADVVYKNQQRQWLCDAIIMTMHDYNPNIPYDFGDISKMVWFRYNQARRQVREATRLMKERLERQRQAELLEIRRIAAQKRAAKEAAEIERLGREKYENRMKTQQHIKNTSEHSVSVQYLEKFKEFLSENPKWDHFGVDLAEKKMVFMTDVCDGVVHRENVEKVPQQYMWKILLELCAGNWQDGDLNDFKLQVTVSWNRTHDGFPNFFQKGYHTENHNWSPLQGNPRITSPHTFDVTSAFELFGNKVLGSTHFSYPITKLLPKEFRKCQNMVSPKSHCLLDCYQLPKQFDITSITLQKKGFPKMVFREKFGNLQEWEACFDKPALGVIKKLYQRSDSEYIKKSETLDKVQERINSLKVKPLRVKIPPKVKRDHKLEEKLYSAKHMLDNGLISQADYNQIKSQVIKQLF
jgi:hypothetical protein